MMPYKKKIVVNHPGTCLLKNPLLCNFDTCISFTQLVSSQNIGRGKAYSCNLPPSNYRPRTKYDGRLNFQFACHFTPGGGGFLSLWSQIPCQPLVPCPFCGRYPGHVTSPAWEEGGGGQFCHKSRTEVLPP